VIFYLAGASFPDVTSASVSLYDVTSPYIRWGYEPATKTAAPFVTSCGYALSALAKKQGRNAVIRQYQLPKDFKFLDVTPAFYANQSLPSGIESTHTTLLYPPRKGREKVAGYVCDVYRLENPLGAQTIWVEPKSGLILKREGRMKGVPGARTAPRRPSGYVVRRIRFYPRLPISRFQLPAGTTARVPALFKDVPLPPGVKRVRMTGPRALSGFDFAGARRQFEYQRRGASAPVRNG
jgi:hypothetical protein